MDEGFPRENLLTEDARKIWMLWKENHSPTTGGGRGCRVRNGRIPVEAPRRPRHRPDLARFHGAPNRRTLR